MANVPCTGWNYILYSQVEDFKHINRLCDRMPGLRGTVGHCEYMSSLLLFV